MPQNTHAVVVGIECYEVSDAWTLDGPVRDAVRFVDWLLERGVPKEQIILLLSPSKKNKAYVDALNGTLYPRPKSASQSEVDRVLTDELDVLADRMEGEGTLFLFWAGHGSVDHDRERHLFFSDSTRRSPRNISVKAIQNHLLSSPVDKFRSQLLLIEACANHFYYVSSPSDLRSGDLGRIRKPSLRAVSQDVFFSASVGQSAKGSAIKETGAFSKILLDVLKGYNRKEWPPDGEALFVPVKAHFREPDGKQVPQQNPFWISLKIRDCQYEDGHLPMPGGPLTQPVADIIEPRLEESANATLSAVVQRLGVDNGPLPATTAEVLEQAREADRLHRLPAALQSLGLDRPTIMRTEEELRTIEQVTSVLKKLGKLKIPHRKLMFFYRKSCRESPIPAHSLCELLRVLCQMPPADPDEVSPLHQFVLLVAKAETRNDLVDWVRSAVPDTAAVDRLWAHIQTEPPLGHLLVEVPEPENDEPSLNVWIYDERDGLRPAATVPCLGTSPGQVHAALVQVIDDVVESTDRHWVIELFLSYAQLGWDIDQWRQPLRLMDSRIGAERPVLLRWLDRAQNGYRTKPGAWRRIAGNMRNSDGVPYGDAVHWMTEQACRKASPMADYERTGRGFCIGFGFVPYLPDGSLSGDLAATLNAGMPYGLWLRRDPGNWEEFRRTLNERLSGNHIDEIPHALQDYRTSDENAGHSGRHLSLFWDNPNINPWSDRFTTPGQRVDA